MSDQSERDRKNRSGISHDYGSSKANMDDKWLARGPESMVGNAYMNQGLNALLGVGQVGVGGAMMAEPGPFWKIPGMIGVGAGIDTLYDAYMAPSDRERYRAQAQSIRNNGLPGRPVGPEQRLSPFAPAPDGYEDR